MPAQVPCVRSSGVGSRLVRDKPVRKNLEEELDCEDEKEDVLRESNDEGLPRAARVDGRGHRQADAIGEDRREDKRLEESGLDDRNRPSAWLLIRGQSVQRESAILASSPPHDDRWLDYWEPTAGMLAQ